MQVRYNCLCRGVWACCKTLTLGRLCKMYLKPSRSNPPTSKPANCQPCALPCWELCAWVTGVAFSRSQVADASNRPDVACRALIQSDSLKPSSWRRFTDIAIVLNSKWYREKIRKYMEMPKPQFCVLLHKDSTQWHECLENESFRFHVNILPTSLHNQDHLCWEYWD